MKNLQSPMVAHALPWYAPESWGGTAQYLEAFANAELLQGLCLVGMALMFHAGSLESSHQGPPKLRLKPYVVEAHSTFWGNRVGAAGAGVLHLIGWTPFFGRSQLQCAFALDLATVTTVHVPAWMWATGTKMHFSETRYPLDRARTRTAP